MQNGKNLQTDQSRFNLVDEPWIPVVGKGLSSLREIFSEPDIRALSGNPIQKIALTKLLLAISQAACTPKDTDDLNKLDVEIFRNTCIAYLEQWYDRFWLYGKRPFLQMPALLNLIDYRKSQELKSSGSPLNRKKTESNATPKSIGWGFYPDMPAENNTILTQHQTIKIKEDADKALFIVGLMNFAFAGKRVEKNLPPLSPDFTGKSNSAKPAPSIGNYVGYLHSFLSGPTIIDTLILNLLSQEQILANPFWKFGLGKPPWEQMPQGESCKVANLLRQSYMSTLISVSRFVLLYGSGIYYVEGIQYPSHKDGWIEPSMCVNLRETPPKVIWVDPNKRPWRELPSMLAFLNANSSNGYECLFIKYGFEKAKKAYRQVGIWAGGLRVSTNSGDQSVKQDNDFVESLFVFDSDTIDEKWYEQFQIEMVQIEQVDKLLYTATKGYFDKQNMDGSALASQVSSLFWQMCERRFQDLVNACEETNDLPAIRKSIASIALKAFDTYCPKETVRQIDAWAKSRPNLSKYLSNN